MIAGGRGGNFEAAETDDALESGPVLAIVSVSVPFESERSLALRSRRGSPKRMAMVGGCDEEMQELVKAVVMSCKAFPYDVQRMPCARSGLVAIGTKTFLMVQLLLVLRVLICRGIESLLSSVGVTILLRKCSQCDYHCIDWIRNKGVSYGQ